MRSNASAGTVTEQNTIMKNAPMPIPSSPTPSISLTTSHAHRVAGNRRAAAPKAARLVAARPSRKDSTTCTTPTVATASPSHSAASAR